MLGSQAGSNIKGLNKDMRKNSVEKIQDSVKPHIFQTGGQRYNKLKVESMGGVDLHGRYRATVKYVIEI